MTENSDNANNVDIRNDMPVETAIFGTGVVLYNSK